MDVVPSAGGPQPPGRLLRPLHIAHGADTLAETGPQIRRLEENSTRKL
jgi:hypothetical protein